jgi:amino acid transporter
MTSSGLSRQLGLRSLTLAVVTSTIGSGWLFAPFYAARSAGPAALGAWLLGGVLAFSLALVFAELGSLVSSSGALAQIPLLSHGRTAGFIGGWSAWIAYLALPTIEVLAVMQYLASSFPWLTADGGSGQVLSGPGLALATALLALLAWINLAGVGWLARWLDGLTAWKLAIPLVISVTLMLASGHWGNLAASRQAPGETLQGMVTAISSGGILFSLLGFRTAMDLAGETRQPQRTVPLAMALGLGISLGIYLILQLAFLVSIPPDQLAGGWARLELTAHGGPLVALAMGLGLGWVARLLLLDAVISPSATAMAYMGASARVSWMMGRCGLLPSSLGRLNRQAVPSVALLVSLVMGVLMLLSGPSWQTVVSFLTATLVIALAMGPVSLVALRQQLPDAHRAYRLPWAGAWCSSAFVLATWAISWCGTSSLRGASLIVLVPAGVFALADRQQLCHGLWWFLYLGGIVAITNIELNLTTQLTVLAIWALVVFPIATSSRLPQLHPMVEMR